MPGTDTRFPDPLTDTRFLTPGADARFPSPGTDTRFPSPGVDARFTDAAFTPLSIPGLIGWFDAAELSTLTLDGSNNVTAMSNRVPGRNPVNAGPGGGPLYDPAGAGGLPAVVWPTSGGNSLSLELGFDAPCSEIFVVQQYSDGNVVSIGSGGAIFNQNMDGSKVVRTGNWTSYLQGSYVERLSMNSGPFTNTVLPLPLSVVRYSQTETNGEPVIISVIGGNAGGATTQSWRGPICEILAYSEAVSLSAQDIKNVEAYLAAKWGLSTAAALHTFNLTVGSGSGNHGYSEGNFGTIDPVQVTPDSRLRWMLVASDNRMYFKTQGVVFGESVLRLDATVDGTLYRMRMQHNGSEYFTNAADAVDGFQAALAATGSPVVCELYAAT